MHLIRIGQPCMQPYTRADLGEFHRIGDEIDQDLPEQALIAIKARDRWLNLRLHDQATAERAGRHHAHDGLNQPFQIDHALIQLQAPGFDFGHVEDFIDDLQEVIGAGVHILDIFRVFLILHRAKGLRDHHVRETDNRIQRRTQLMRHIRQERRFGLVGGVRLLFGLNQRMLHALPQRDIHDRRHQEPALLGELQRRRGIERIGHTPVPADDFGLTAAADILGDIVIVVDPRTLALIGGDDRKNVIVDQLLLAPAKGADKGLIHTDNPAIDVRHHDPNLGDIKHGGEHGDRIIALPLEDGLIGHVRLPQYIQRDDLPAVIRDGANEERIHPDRARNPRQSLDAHRTVFDGGNLKGLHKMIGVFRIHEGADGVAHHLAALTVKIFQRKVTGVCDEIGAIRHRHDKARHRHVIEQLGIIGFRCIFSRHSSQFSWLFT